MRRAWRELVDGHDGVAWQVASKDFLLTVQDQQAGTHQHALEGALAIQEALRERARVIRQLCKATVSETWHQHKSDSFAKDPPTNHDDRAFTQLLLPRNLASWLASNLEITFTASASGWRNSHDWEPAVGDAICVRFMRTPCEQLRLLWHCLPSSNSSKGQVYLLELALIELSRPGCTLVSRQVPIHGTWLYPDPESTCFAWRCGSSTVVVTSMLDLQDVATVQLDGPPQCSPVYTSKATPSRPATDSLDIKWSASCKLLAITVRQLVGVRDTFTVASADLYFCDACDSRVLHKAVLEELTSAGSCFSPDDQHFAICGRQEGAEFPWSQLLLLKIATETWQHASLSAPVPLDCTDIVSGPNSLWLACALLCYNDESSSGNGSAGNTYHEWTCANGGGAEFLVKFDSNRDSFRVVINAANGKVVYMWQADSDFMHHCISVSPAGIFDSNDQRMVYIRPNLSRSALDELACKPSLSSHGKRLQAVEGPRLPVSCGAIFSPNGEVLVDCNLPMHRFSRSVLGPRSLDILHHCHQSGRSYSICLGKVSKVADAFSPVWLPQRPHRPIYAVLVVQHTVHLIDAFHYCILLSWSTCLAMPTALAEDALVDLAMCNDFAQLTWLQEGEGKGIAALYRLKTPPQSGAWCHVTSFT